jgi:UDP-glucose 4-epimerase
MSSRFVVTGGAGFIGSHLIQRLLGQGDVLALSRSLIGVEHPRLTFMRADLALTIPDSRAFRGATVIHCAAVMNSADRSALWSGNVVATWNLLGWAIRHEVRHFVFFSSGGVYGYAKDHPWSEGDPTNPIGFYGHTKLMAEDLTRAFQDTAKLAVSVIRLFFPYGEGQKRGIFRLISDAVQKGTALTVNRGGAPRINPIHIGDVVSATEMLLALPAGYRVFNLCGDETVSFLDLVKQSEAKYGKKAVLKSSDLNHDDLLGSNRLLKERTGWLPIQRLAA